MTRTAGALIPVKIPFMHMKALLAHLLIEIFIPYAFKPRSTPCPEVHFLMSSFKESFKWQKRKAIPLFASKELRSPERLKEAPHNDKKLDS